MLKAALLAPLTLVALYHAAHFATRKEYKTLEAGGILITGASSGIGRHAAISLAQRGYLVYAGVRKQSDADSIIAEGVTGLAPVILDVAKPDTVDATFETIQSQLSAKKLPFVALVNNAGIARTFPVEMLDMDRDVRENFEVNYFGVVAITQKFLPLLRATGNGARLVQISSVAGLISSAGGNPYAATKFVSSAALSYRLLVLAQGSATGTASHCIAWRELLASGWPPPPPPPPPHLQSLISPHSLRAQAVEALNDALRLELAPFKISVSAVNPAFVATPILGNPGGKGEKNKATAKSAAKPELLSTYSHLINEKNEAEEQKFYAMADSPQVTTDAITHAISAPYPEVRYIVANVVSLTPTFAPSSLHFDP